MQKTGTTIICKNTGWMFRGLKETANAFGFTSRALARHLNGHGSRSSVNGFKFTRLGPVK